MEKKYTPPDEATFRRALTNNLPTVLKNIPTLHVVERHEGNFEDCAICEAYYASKPDGIITVPCYGDPTEYNWNTAPQYVDKFEHRFYTVIGCLVLCAIIVACALIFS